ncbi:GAF domain-containing protein [Streptomyces tsukubensis]|uniref:Histidine kinase n=1 Tax=Streptomyces tsukubensis TaxID=83656 RepID=A0A1V4AEG4_9ACTN|nr:GAF domain-containing protein [Streptomyces tsukubensis]OON81873.1 histidine kinase [Streptomyces tsukubensis]QFR96662.1 GAF domain-containing protein [Streptomyces tsukubensis]
MTSTADGHLLLTPADKEAPARVRRLRDLGLGERPDAWLDGFAARLARITGAPCAMVNFIDENRQFFAGLHAPALPAHSGDAATPLLGRYLPRDHGYCPHVVVRRRALVLEDVRDFPRFAGNPVVDDIGIRSYLGAPLIDRTGIALGTVCVVDTAPRAWGKEGLTTIKNLAGELIDDIHRHEAGSL